MCDPIFSDTFNHISRYLNEVDVRLKLFQSEHVFHLISPLAAKKYNLIITMLKVIWMKIRNRAVLGIMGLTAEAYAGEPAKTIQL